jgi:hypothetical protein
MKTELLKLRNDLKSAKLLDIDGEDQRKVTDKEPFNYDKGDLLEDLCERMDKVKLNDRIPNNTAIRRSTRPKNSKSAKLDDFLWKNV